MRARLFPLGSKTDDDLSSCTTPADRLSLVADLSREAWALSKREMPAYARSELPVTVIHLRSRGE